MKHLKKILITTVGFFFLPFVVFGADSIKDLIEKMISSVLKPIIPFVVSLTVVYFLYGTAMYIMYAGDANKRDEGRKAMLRGIFALFIMACFWGIAKILVNTFGF